jgi:hypothetical protein
VLSIAELPLRGAPARAAFVVLGICMTEPAKLVSAAQTWHDTVHVMMAYRVGHSRVLAATFKIGDTVLLSPLLRRCEGRARQAVAEATYRRAELNHQAAVTRAQGAAEAAWEPWLVGPSIWRAGAPGRRAVGSAARLGRGRPAPATPPEPA